MECKFCCKECKNSNSLRNHERLCKQNPDRQYTPFQDLEKQKEISTNRGNKNQWSVSNYSISNETRKKLSEGAKLRNARESSKTKEKRKSTIAHKVRQNEWHTSLAKNMHYNYAGVDLHGKWELKYAIWLDGNNIQWERCRESFEYVFGGKARRYTPDFYLVDTKEYVEIKGHQTEKDIAKWDQFPSHKTLKVLKVKDLKELGVIA